MKSTILAICFAAVATNALPGSILKGQPPYTDVDILNYALTLEHLESAFYIDGLSKYNKTSFVEAGFKPSFRSRIGDISAQEAIHVSILNATIGPTAVKPCQYNFPHTDPTSFALLAQVLEGIGVAAYIGAARYISNKDYLTAAMSILSTEVRHASFIAAAQNHIFWNGPFDVPLDLSESYTLAANYITSCPGDNTPISAQAFPQLSIGIGGPGQAIALSYNITNVQGVTDSSPLWGHYLTGLIQVVQPVQLPNKTIVIPNDLKGTIYLVLARSDTIAKDYTIVAGPAVLHF